MNQPKTKTKLDDFFSKNKAKNSYENLKILLYGDTNTGKSVFANTFPGKSVLISTDGNYKNLPFQDNFKVLELHENKYIKHYVKGKQMEIHPWDWFKSFVNLASQPNRLEADNIIIDLFGDLFEIARTYALQKNSITDETMMPHGRGYLLVAEEFIPVFKQLMLLKKNVILITHEKIEHERRLPLLKNWIFRKIKGYFQIIAWLTCRKTDSNGYSHLVEVMPSLYHDAKNIYNIDTTIKNNYKMLIDEIKKQDSKRAEIKTQLQKGQK